MPSDTYPGTKYEYVIREDGTWSYKEITGAQSIIYPDFLISTQNAQGQFLAYFSEADLRRLGDVIARQVVIYMWGSLYLDKYLFETGGGIHGDVEAMEFMAPRIGMRAKVAGATEKYYVMDQQITSSLQTFEEVMSGDVRQKFVNLFLSTVVNSSVSTQCPADKRSTLHYSYKYGSFHWREAITSNLQIPATGALVQDAPYYMLCIPEVGTKVKVGNQTWTQEVDAYQIYNQLQVNFGAFVYDVQYVPYTPYAIDITRDGTVVLPDSSQVGFAKTPAGAIEAGVYFCNKDRFWFTIEPKLPDTYDALSALKTKVSSETNFARLCSMDGSAMLTINLAKNNGLAPLRMSVRYAPYQSYISIQPQWSVFYGADIGLKDTRGLNITTSNSVSRVSNQWQDYVLNNANYQSIFDRQIQSMDTQFDIQTGAAVRGMIFDGVGTIISAATSGNGKAAALTATSGALDLVQQGLALKDSFDSYKDKRSLNVDMFNLQNGNIKARADTLSKVNAMSPIYNTWPYIEVYETTPEEKAALTTYITEFSMNIGALTSQLSAYVTPNPNARKYIQADIVRLSGKFDAHMADTIKSVISNGIYFVEVTTNE